MNQLAISDCLDLGTLPADLKRFAVRNEVRIELIQEFKHMPAVWAITGSKYNMHDPKHVEMHNEILKALNGAG